MVCSCILVSSLTEPKECYDHSIQKKHDTYPQWVMRHGISYIIDQTLADLSEQATLLQVIRRNSKGADTIYTLPPTSKPRELHHSPHSPPPLGDIRHGEFGSLEWTLADYYIHGVTITLNPYRATSTDNLPKAHANKSNTICSIQVDMSTYPTESNDILTVLTTTTSSPYLQFSVESIEHGAGNPVSHLHHEGQGRPESFITHGPGPVRDNFEGLLRRPFAL